MTTFLCLKAALVEPQLLSLSFNFHVATATYLIHMATDGQQTTFKELKFPLPTSVPLCLSYIPEFVAENTLDYLLFLRRFRDSVYEVGCTEFAKLLTAIIKNNFND